MKRMGSHLSFRILQTQRYQKIIHQSRSYSSLLFFFFFPPPQDICIMAIEIGMIFQNWAELKERVEDWAINDHFQYRIASKDQSRASYYCQHKPSGCTWRLYVSYNRQDELEAKIVQPIHTCAGAPSIPRQASAKIITCVLGVLCIRRT